MPGSALNAVAKVYIKRKYPYATIPEYDLRLRNVPRYAVARTRAKRDRNRAAETEPWITRESIEALRTLLRPTDDGLEFGSGGSTVWLAKHSRSVRAVEAFDPWHTELQKRLADEGVDNATVELVSAPKLGYKTDAHRGAYVNAFPDIAPGSLGYVFVDGEYRPETAMRGADLLAPGGLLILDNANSYLPTDAPVLWKVREPINEAWVEFQRRVADWRYVWTSNGAWDTVIWFKPA